MSVSGQTEKNSVRAYVFRFTLKLGHCSMHSACPKSANRTSRTSFDHLIGAGEQRGWNGEAERLRRLEIDHEPKPLRPVGSTDATNPGLGYLSASGSACRRDSRRSRAGACGRRSRPRHISPAADTADTWSPPAPRAEPA